MSAGVRNILKVGDHKKKYTSKKATEMVAWLIGDI